MTLIDGRDYAYQYDTGLMAIAPGPGKVRFANAKGSKAIPVESEIYDGTVVYPIPDILLTTGRAVIMYTLGGEEGEEYITGESLLPVYQAHQPKG